MICYQFSFRNANSNQHFYSNLYVCSHYLISFPFGQHYRCSSFLNASLLPEVIIGLKVQFDCLEWVIRTAL